jgi:hypothetical protein
MRKADKLLQATALIASLAVAPLTAHAQTAMDQHLGAVYAAAAQVRTAAPGVMTFPDPPASYNPVGHSDLVNAQYGLPPRPTGDAAGLARWTEAMSLGARHSHTPLRVLPIKAGPARDVVRTSSVEKMVSSNWSGNVDLNNAITSYDPTKSFKLVMGEFSMPRIEKAFPTGDNSTCNPVGLIDQWFTGWVGMDGFGNGDVLQAGGYAEIGCLNGTTDYYYGLWSEWYPTNYMTLMMEAQAGDVFFCEVWNTDAKTGYAYCLDKTSNTYQTVQEPPCVSSCSFMGNSAEWIVERPSAGGQTLPLANYTTAFQYYGFARTFDKNNYWPSWIPSNVTNASQFQVSMGMFDANSNLTSIISIPGPMGSAGLVFNVGGCARNGGC